MLALILALTLGLGQGLCFDLSQGLGHLGLSLQGTIKHCPAELYQSQITLQPVFCQVKTHFLRRES